MSRRHRLRRHSLRRRAGMKGDWVPLMHTTCPAPINSPQPCDTAPESLSATFVELLGEDDIHTHDDALTIVRMVGAVNPVMFMTFEITAPLASPVGGIVSCHEGIFVTAESGTSSAEFNPFNEDDFIRDNWLWLRETSFPLIIGGQADGFDNFALAGGSGTTSPPSGPQFDVRVKRRLTFGMALVYVVQWTAGLTLVPAAGGGSLPTSVNLTTAGNLVGSLRGYVKF